MTEPRLSGALRAREPLAPDPETVLAGARKRIRRRRTVSLTAAVLVTVGGLGAAGAVVLNQPSDETRLPVAAPAAGEEQVTVPELPFTFSAPGFKLANWQLSNAGGRMSAEYHGSATVLVGVDNSDPGKKFGDPKRVTVNGKPAIMSTDAPMGGQVSWQVAPDKWIYVWARNPLDYAKHVSETPTRLTALLRSLRVPSSLRVVTWGHAAGDDMLTLCPPKESWYPPAAECVSVWLPANETGYDPNTEIYTDQERATLDKVSRKLDNGRTVTVSSPHAEHGVLTAIASSVVPS
ncbi:MULTISPECIES: hypothetical protein [Amycolatopsis]|uniref:Uncharacterized protein n=2 Tax=Amycolatopsis TaxID=1813 RepID=A0A1I3YQM8_9PSEU|nr:hypothetical protein [Amycolatopsis sacchari]SFK34257.1 hypothetical protein SAMN05421835_118136 [Amycolatopsis sacchari]